MITSKKNHLEYIEECLSNFDKIGFKDCYLVLRTGDYESIIGEPLAIFKSKKALRKNFKKICDRTDDKFGVTIMGYKFDDEEDFD